MFCEGRRSSHQMMTFFTVMITHYVWGSHQTQLEMISYGFFLSQVSQYVVLAWRLVLIETPCLSRSIADPLVRRRTSNRRVCCRSVSELSGPSVLVIHAFSLGAVTWFPSSAGYLDSYGISASSQLSPIGDDFLKPFLTFLRGQCDFVQTTGHSLGHLLDWALASGFSLQKGQLIAGCDLKRSKHSSFFALSTHKQLSILHLI